jgi:hypothetical protein
VLKSVNARARQCHEWAFKARQRALETTDPVLRDEYLASEARWLKLAESYELTERLTDFLNKPPTFPKHPECPNCHVPMWLVAMQSGSESVEYLYECKACEETVTLTGQGEHPECPTIILSSKQETT